MKCKSPCLDDHKSLGEWAWHFAYNSWYAALGPDHAVPLRPFRSAAWGWVADRIVRWA